MSCLYRRLSPPRPQHALVTARPRPNAFVDKLLHALTLVGFGCVEIALGVGRNAVHAIELARLASAIAERGHLLERLSHDDAYALILAVCQHEETLIGILGKCDVPDRS